MAVSASASRINGLTPRRARARAATWPVTLLAFASVAALFFISNLTMAALGLAYETAGGAQWEKIAPGTYFAFAALLALLATRPSLAAFADEIVRRHKGLIVFFLCWLALFIYIVKFHGSPLTATFARRVALSNRPT